jgi:hypothetical protein
MPHAAKLWLETWALAVRWGKKLTSDFILEDFWKYFLPKLFSISSLSCAWMKSESSKTELSFPDNEEKPFNYTP